MTIKNWSRQKVAHTISWVFAIILMLLAVLVLSVDVIKVIVKIVETAYFLNVSVKEAIQGVLDGFIILELIRSFGDYLENEKIHLYLIIETTLVFTVREIFNILVSNHVELGEMIGVSVLVLALVYARFLSCKLNCEG